MKKLYIHPTSRTIHLEMNELVAQSPTVGIEGDAGNGYTTGDGSNADSRNGGSLWGDDEW